MFLNQILAKTFTGFSEDHTSSMFLVNLEQSFVGKQCIFPVITIPTNVLPCTQKTFKFLILRPVRFDRRLSEFDSRWRMHFVWQYRLRTNARLIVEQLLMHFEMVFDFMNTNNVTIYFGCCTARPFWPDSVFHVSVVSCTVSVSKSQ